MRVNWAAVSYILGSIVAFVAVAGTGQRIVNNLKTRWISDAEKQRTQKENTDAVKTLTGEIKSLRDMIETHINNRSIHSG